jgi:hypothetical protein
MEDLDGDQTELLGRLIEATPAALATLQDLLGQSEVAAK